MIKQAIKYLIPKKVRTFLLNSLKGYKNISYSQEGEDLILKRVFQNKKDGFFVDIGAHHPKRFSNTYIFYKMGWRGINIDAMPGSMIPFNKIRKRDINLEIPVSDSEGVLKYYSFSDPALNGFLSAERAAQIQKIGYDLLFTKDLNTMPLGKILDKYLPPNSSIDFLSIDVEGLDFKVLSSNDWSLYQPSFILVEVRDFNIATLDTDEVYKLLIGFGYTLYAKTVNTVFFKHKSFVII